MTIKLPKDLQRRTQYIERVSPFMGKNLIKVFTGQRRVGKSYLLFQLMARLLEQDENVAILYINKEDLAFSFIKTSKDLQEYVLANKSTIGKTFVFIDEIQDILHFETALRSLLLQEDLDLYC